jgi:hypothetical protein
VCGQVRFLAPGSMVCNLDFVESIFGNAENPDLAENDAALDPEHWTGTTGMVILAPHLIKMKKKELGLPHISEATERQKRDGMCYTDENELYNGGSAFKVGDFWSFDTFIQLTIAPQGYLPRCPRCCRHRHCRQLLRLLQERSQDSARNGCQSLWTDGGENHSFFLLCAIIPTPELPSIVISSFQSSSGFTHFRISNPVER